MFCENYVMGLVCLSVCLSELSLPFCPRYFFTYLLPHQAPPGLTHLVNHIMNSTGEDERRLDMTGDVKLLKIGKQIIPSL